MALFLCNFTKTPGKTHHVKPNYFFCNVFSPDALVKLHKNSTIGSHLFRPPSRRIRTPQHVHFYVSNYIAATVFVIFFFSATGRVTNCAAAAVFVNFVTFCTGATVFVIELYWCYSFFLKM